MPAPRASLAPTASYEEERTYALDPGLTLPDLTGAGPVSALGSARTQRLDATYWDTPDLRLAARRIRLRRRTGGSDAGWHVKLPDGVGVTEVHLPVGRARDVPAPLASLLAAHVREAELVPVARLRTRRTEVELLGESGEPLALLADDDVTGESFEHHGAGTGDPTSSAGGDTVHLQRWREIEVELVEGAGGGRGDGSGLLEAVEERLLAAGARVAEHPSKVGRVLGARVPPPWPDTARVRRRAPARDVLTAHLREQVDALIVQDVLVRRDQPDSVHKMRVATRRIRSALRTFRPLLDEQLTRPLGEELRWLANELGGMRDREVLLARLLGEVDKLPAEQVLGPVAARIESSLTADFAAARTRALGELDGDRYRSLVGALVALAADPPYLPGTGGRAQALLPPLVRKVHRRLRRQLEAAHAGAEDAAFHEARKTAKRLRYAAESLEPAFGAPARHLAARAEHMQEVLGEHQDSVVARDELRALALAAHGHGENAFTYGVLWGLERDRAEAAERASAHVARRLRRRKANALYG